jgi:hypothetical protein
MDVVSGLASAGVGATQRPERVAAARTPGPNPHGARVTR